MKTLSLPFALLVSFAIAAPVVAQDLLVIERKADRRGRDLLLSKFKRTRVTMNLHKASADDVIKYLNVASGDTAQFIFSGKSMKAAEVPEVDLQLKKISLYNVMGVLQEAMGVRFVYRSGIVFVKPKDEVKEFTFLRFYDVRAATMKMPVFKAPKLRLQTGEDEGEVDDGGEEVSVSGFDIDKLTDLVRTMVLPDSWDTEKASIIQMNGVLAIRQTETGHKKVRALLVQFGAIPPVRYKIVRGPRPYVNFGRLRKPAPKKTPGKKSASKPASRSAKPSTKKSPRKVSK